MTQQEIMEDYKVSATITDGEGNEWVIAQKWEHEKHFDLALFHKESGSRGSFRIMKH